MSRKVVSLVDLDLVREVPWGPHDGLKLTIRKNVREVLVRRMVKPLPYDHSSLQSTAAAPWHMPWAEAKREAEQELKDANVAISEALRDQRALMNDIGALDESIDLGNKLMHWSRAVEHQALAARGIDSHGGNASKAKGRSMPPRFVDAPIARRRCDPGAQRLPGGYNDRARLWATLKVLVARLLRAKTASDDTKIKASRIIIIRCAAGCDQVSWRVWVTITSHADAGAARMAIYRACRSDSTAADVNASLELLSRLEADEVASARRHASARWHAWVANSLRGGAKAAHAWTNAPNTVPAEVFAPGLSSPLEVVGYHTSKWSEVWEAGELDKVRAAVETVKALRVEALRDKNHGKCSDHINADFLKRLAESFSRNTAIGADAQAFTDIAMASEEALTELAEIMVQVIKAVAWPLQSLMVVMGLLGKKSGGTRTIAIMATFARLLLAAVKGDVRRWDETIADERDTALRGRRPADETARRHLGVEVSTVLGRIAVMILWDMRAFFDSLETEKLADAARAAGFPLDQLALGLTMHRAPRVLRVHGCYGDCIPRTGRSVLAGCTLSTSFARAYLEPLAKACASDELGTLWKHVDDLTQCILAPTKQLAAARAIQKGQLLAAEATKLGLRIADKSRVVSNFPAVARDVARGVRGDGVPILAADRAEDLGVTTTAGRRRGTTSLSARLVKGLRRARRVRQLVAANRGAQKLFRTGVDPQQGYEGPIIGVAPPQLRAMRRNAALSVATAGLRPCLASLLAWRLDDDSDPAIREPLKQVQLWRRLWSTTPDADKADLRKAWRRALPKVLLKGVRWGSVSGPMQATIATVGQLGWAPVQPDRWLTEDRTQYADLSETAPEAGGQIELQLKMAAKRVLWRGAAGHHLGGGLDHGIPSFGAAREARRWLIKHHRPAEVKALDQVVCGGLWCGGREHVQRKCRCGVPETAWHRYWGCSLLDEVVDKSGGTIVSDTQWLAKEFDGDLGKYQCLWGRAILPGCLVDPGPEITAERASESMFVSSLFQDLVKEGEAIYSDGSGGPRYAPRGFPVAGSGLAVLKWNELEVGMNLEGLAVAAGPVPGRQTVPRAELWSACAVGELVPSDVPVRLLADASYVVDTAADDSRLNRARRAANGDLWSRFAACRESRSSAMNVRKVEAHAPPGEVLNGLRDFDKYIGNHIADAAAGAAAEMVLDQSVQARSIEMWERRAFLIARRLAAIEAWHWEHVPNQRYQPPEPLQPWSPPDQQEARSGLLGKVGDKGHVLRKVDGRIMCIKCHRRRDPRNYQYWLKVNCRPVANLPREPPRAQAQLRSRLEPRQPPAADDILPPLSLDDHGVAAFQDAATAGTALGSARGPPDGTYHQGTQDQAGYLGYGRSDDHDVGHEDLHEMHSKRRRVDLRGVTDEGDFLPTPPRGQVRGRGAQGDAVAIEASKRQRVESDEPGGPVGAAYVEAVSGASSSSNPLSLTDDLAHGRQCMQADIDVDTLDDQEYDDMTLGQQLQHDRDELVQHSPNEDPFGFGGLDFDQGEAGVGISGEDCGVEQVVAAAVASAPTADAAYAHHDPVHHGHGHREPAEPQDRPPPPGDGLVTARERRRLVLEQLAERRKRRRLEIEVVTRAWGEGDAVVEAGDFVDLPVADGVPPFAVHDTHQLVCCGGYSGCIRCGRVVAYQGHDRFAAPCRGFCPSGSARPVRRLARGDHPYPAARGHLADRWPSGEAAPVPRRFRPTAG